jgi:hypothetical protein
MPWKDFFWKTNLKDKTPGVNVKQPATAFTNLNYGAI